MYDIEIEDRLREISKQIGQERTRDYENTEFDRIHLLRAKTINDDAFVPQIVRQVLNLRTPEYTLVMPSHISAPKYAPICAPTDATTFSSAQNVKIESNWKRRLATTVFFYVLLQFRGVLFETDTFVATPTAKLIDSANLLFSPISNISHQINLHNDYKNQDDRLFVHDREDITSFAFDLGGTTCACLLAWDVQQYWQRVFYGLCQ